MQKEIPILFSTDMVRAILAGNKTQTRRVIKNHPCTIYDWDNDPNVYTEDMYHTYETFISEATGKLEGPEWLVRNGDGDCEDTLGQCPYGKVGDLLWVRETWRKYFPCDGNGFTDFSSPVIEYAADNPEPQYMVDGDGFQMYNKDGSEKFIPFKPSIHMPKEAARIWLQVTDIRVERLKDISIQGCISEGIEGENRIMGFKDYTKPEAIPYLNAYNSFCSLWSSINGPDSWQANPWVWVVCFKVLSTTGKPQLTQEVVTERAMDDDIHD